jgi:uncharacterized DUF497 family protein
MNLAKHGIPFQQAVEVFFDPFFRIIDASPVYQNQGMQ